MSKTYRRSSNGVRSDGGRHYSTPRYRAGSRRKPRRIKAVGIRNESPDVERLSRAIARAALNDKADVPYLFDEQPGKANRPPDQNDDGGADHA